MITKKYIHENLLTKDKRLNLGKCSWLPKRDYETYKSIINETSFLDHDSSLNERIWCIVNDVQIKPLCEQCNINKKPFQNFNKGYRKYCSTVCASKNDEVKNKRKHTNKEKYGGHPINNSDVRQKLKQTNNVKYGSDYAISSDNVKNKIKRTIRSKYNVDNISQLNIVKNKKQSSYSDYYNTKILTKEYIFNCINQKMTTNEISNKTGISPITINRYILKHYGECNPNRENIKVSSVEKEIRLYLGDENIITNDRKLIYPKELDIVIPNKKLAIEVDGVYWHSYNRPETNEEKKYHLNKTILCNQNDYDLLHIYDIEWKNKKDIWKSIINNKLGLSNRIYARKCNIQELNKDETERFVNSNHLQGYTHSSINIGLYYNSELVSVMTFSKSRYNKNIEYELIRFCNKKHLTVIGGANKIFRYFIKKYKPSSIISYSDIRYSNGNLYKKLGFQYSHRSNPNYKYFDGNKLYSRVYFQKHKLKHKLNYYNPDMTEAENMFNNGYRRLWDCGNDVWVYK